MEVKFSIVIPNYNGRHLLKKNLPAVLKACRAWGKTDWEVIVVDDASTDGSLGFLKNNYSQIKVVEHQKNQRFAAACNSGVNAAKGEIVVLLNNDVVPELDFLKPLLVHFKNLEVFAVGCKEKNIKDGKVVYSGRGLGKFKRGFLVHWRAEDQDRTDTLWATAGSMAVNRKKWLKLGGMDTLFRPAYWEDIDLSWRAKKQGWKVFFEPKSEVFHQHETTNIAAFGKKQMKKYAYKNQFLFVWKNGNGKMLCSHFVWFPYHLIKAIIKGDWLFLEGFLLALMQLPGAIKRRF